MRKMIAVMMIGLMLSMIGCASVSPVVRGSAMPGRHNVMVGISGPLERKVPKGFERGDPNMHWAQQVIIEKPPLLKRKSTWVTAAGILAGALIAENNDWFGGRNSNSTFSEQQTTDDHSRDLSATLKGVKVEGNLSITINQTFEASEETE